MRLVADSGSLGGYFAGVVLSVLECFCFAGFFSFFGLDDDDFLWVVVSGGFWPGAANIGTEAATAAIVRAIRLFFISLFLPCGFFPLQFHGAPRRAETR